MTEINKNTYYGIPRWLIALSMTLKRGNGKYGMSKKDLKAGNYFLINIPVINIELKVPFKAIFKMNNKTKGIYGLSFSTGKYCPSLKMGLCQLHSINDCYAIVGEERNKNDLNKDGTLKMNSLYHGFLSIECLKQLSNDADLLERFIAYINNNKAIEYIRFNINGDFKSMDDLILIQNIAYGFNGTIYGYTARDDLIGQYNHTLMPFDGGKYFNTFLAFKNAYLNGSNKMYDNQFICTYSLSTYLSAIIEHRNCLGNCINCKKCFKLVNAEIINLFHRKDADMILNTFNNRMFLHRILVTYGLKIKTNDLNRWKGLFYSFNQYMIKTYEMDLKEYGIKGLKDLMIFIASLDSIYNVSYFIECIKEYGLK